MSEPKQDQGFIIASLIEANDILQSEVIRHRASNSLLRRVNSALRQSITSLQKQVAVAAENDQMFKDFCEGKFDAPNQFVAEVTHETDGGLPNAESVVESAV